MLTKGDPVYYKKAIGDLLKEAMDSGLVLNITVDNKSNTVQVVFKDKTSEEAAMITLKGELNIK